MQTATQLDPALTWLDTARRVVRDPDDAEALTWLGRGPPLPNAAPPPFPPGLAYRPADLPPAPWHAQRLVALATEEGDRVLRAYHARWLWHALAPADPESLPLISVVIPVYDRADLLLQAIESVLADGYPRIELCIADDASAADPLPLIQHLGPRLRYVRRPVNGGIAAARQSALELASGELVQLLDSDDLLLPGGLRAKVAALAAVPDAGLCFSRLRTQVIEQDGSMTELQELEPGRAACPTQAGPTSMVRWLPFVPSVLLIARHVMLAVGFDPSDRLGEDRLAFARLGMAGIKSVALRACYTQRRSVPSSVTRAPNVRPPPRSIMLEILCAAVRLPQLWPACGTLTRQAFATWSLLHRVPAAMRQAQFATLLQELTALVAVPPAGLSVAPLLADLAAALGDTVEPHARLAHQLLAPLTTLAERAAPPGAHDLALWRAAPIPGAGDAALRCLFAALSAAIRRGGSWVPLIELDQRPFRARIHPARRRWRLLARLARHLGEGPARLAGRLLG